MTKMRFALFIILVCLISAAAFSLSGCASLKNIASGASYESGNMSGGAGVSGESYKRILGEYSKKADIYNKFDTVMYLRATYYSKNFIKAYVKKYADYYMLSGRRYRDKMRKSLTDFNRYIRCFVSVYTPKKSYNDFGSSRSIWMIYLKNSQNESVMPLSVEPAPEKKVFLKRFFPYVSSWSKQYIIKFPVYFNKKTKTPFISGNTRWIELVITGVNGSVVLKWNLDEK